MTTHTRAHTHTHTRAHTHVRAHTHTHTHTHTLRLGCYLLLGLLSEQHLCSAPSTVLTAQFHPLPQQQRCICTVMILIMESKGALFFYSTAPTHPVSMPRELSVIQSGTIMHVLLVGFLTRVDFYGSVSISRRLTSNSTSSFNPTTRLQAAILYTIGMCVYKCHCTK